MPQYLDTAGVRRHSVEVAEATNGQTLGSYLSASGVRRSVVGIAYVSAGQSLGSYRDHAGIIRPIIGVHTSGEPVSYRDSSNTLRWSTRVAVVIAGAQIGSFLSNGTRRPIMGITGGGTPTPTPTLMIAGTNSRIGDGTYAVSSSRDEYAYTSTHILGYDSTEVVATFMQWHVNVGAENVPTAGTNLIKYALLWYDGTTKRSVPITFSGSRVATILPGDELSFDPITPASYGHPSLFFPRGSIFQIRALGGIIGGTGTISLGTPCTLTSLTPGQTSAGIFTGASKVYPAANRVDNVDSTTAALSSGSGSVDMQHLGLPTMFMGLPTAAAAATAVSILYVGDSISVGLAASNNPMKSLAGYGYGDSAAVDPANLGLTVALGHSGRQTETLEQWLNNRVRRTPWLAKCNVVILQHITNSLFNSGDGPAIAYDGTNKGSPLLNMQFTFSAFYALARSFPNVKRVYQCNTMPRALNSSDSWTTKAGQNVQPGWMAGGVRDQIETWWASLVGTQLDGVFDVRTPAADPTDNHYWVSNGTASYATADGIHPSAAIHLLSGDALRTALLAISL